MMEHKETSDEGDHYSKLLSHKVNASYLLQEENSQMTKGVVT